MTQTAKMCRALLGELPKVPWRIEPSFLKAADGAKPTEALDALDLAIRIAERHLRQLTELRPRLAAIMLEIEAADRAFERAERERER